MSLPLNMSFSRNLQISFFLFINTFFTPTNTATIEIQNQCPFTVWAAATPGGGRKLDQAENWTLSTTSASGRIWARTRCTFDSNGLGSCETGDCGLLECHSSGGRPPNTLAEYSVNSANGFDFFDISLVDGFNVPMEFSPTSEGCSTGVKCAANINEQCPKELRARGGCTSPCRALKTDEYCCSSENCGPSEYTRFFKNRCPDAYSYPMDDATSIFTCPNGTNYRVLFCP